MTDAFLDTNVLLRHLTQDEPHQSPRATALLARIERDELSVRIADTIVFETVFTLERVYRASKSAIREQLGALLSLPGIELPAKSRLARVFDTYAGLNISFADAYHAVLAESLGLSEIYSWDRDFDRVAWLRRLEP